jgi:hypothetical protein
MWEDYSVKPVKLQDYLNTLTKEALVEIVAHLAAGQQQTKQVERNAKKSVYIEWFEASVRNPIWLKAAWDQLEDIERAAITAAVNDPAWPNVLDCHAFLNVHHRLPERTKPVSGSYSRHTTTALCALFLTDAFVVPDEIAEALRPSLPQRKDFTIRVLKAPPPFEKRLQGSDIDFELGRAKPAEVEIRTVLTEAHAMHDILTTLRHIEAGKVTVVTSTKLPGQPGLKSLGAALALGEYPGTAGATELRVGTAIRIPAMVMIAQATRWAVVAPLTGKLHLTQTGMAFLAEPSAQALREGFAHWGLYDGFDEVLRLGLHGAATASAYYGTELMIRRASVCGALTRVNEGAWIDVETFFRLVLASGHNFEVETGARSAFWVGAYGSYFNQPLGSTDSEVYWRVVKCQYMLAMLFETLAAFGVVDIAYATLTRGIFYRGYNVPAGIGPTVSRYDGLRYIRLTKLGAYLLNMTDSYALPVASGPALRVLPNQQIIVTHRMAGTTTGHPVLLKFCERTSDDVYQLDRTKLIKTISTGDMGALDIAEFLRRESDAALPNTVTDLLAEVSRRGTQIEVAGEAILYRVKDETLALELASDKPLMRLGVGRIGDRLVVPRDGVSAFRKRMRDLGYGVVGDDKKPRARRALTRSRW